MRKILRWLNINFEACFGMIFFFIMLGIILMQIFLRNIFGSGTAWGEEICKFCYVWVCYMGLALPQRTAFILRSMPSAAFFRRKYRRF